MIQSIALLIGHLTQIMHACWTKIESVNIITGLHFAHGFRYHLKQQHCLKVPPLLSAVNYPKSNACVMRNSVDSVGGNLLT